MKKKTEVLQKLIDELLSLMGTGAKAAVSYDKKNEVFLVEINTGEEAGLLIGKKGETLSSLQTVLAAAFKQKTDEWYRVVVDVGDYREKEEQYLKDLAMTAAQRAKETGESQNLYNLKSWQRRIIHLFLAEEDGITTESEGEGEDRYLVVRPKK